MTIRERKAMEAAWQRQRRLKDTSIDLKTFEEGWIAGVRYGQREGEVKGFARSCEGYNGEYPFDGDTSAIRVAIIRR